MNNNQLDFIKRVKVKGYPRVGKNGKIYMVSPHYRVIKKLESTSPVKTIRPKLI